VRGLAVALPNLLQRLALTQIDALDAALATSPI